MKDISHKIINLDQRDYHMHSSTFSDGLNTIDEIVQYAGIMGLTEIAITDHSQACLDVFARDKHFYCGGARWSVKNWRNMYNDVTVIFGVEGDLLDEGGNCCFHIQDVQSEFCILSAHRHVYGGDPEKVTDATIKAIQKYADKIKFVAHPCNNNDFGMYYDIERLVDAANYHKIPLEFNAKNLLAGKTNVEKLHIILQKADAIYLNSDAHTLYQLKESRPFAIQFLQEHGYINK